MVRLERALRPAVGVRELKRSRVSPNLPSPMLAHKVNEVADPGLLAAHIIQLISS